MRSFTIREVATLFGVSTDAIRLYEKEGLIAPERNPENGYRAYCDEDLHRIMAISIYRKMKVSIADIKQIFTADSFDSIIAEYDSFISKSEQQIQLLQQQITRISAMKEHIQTLHASFGVCEMRDMPSFYVLFTTELSHTDYDDLFDIISSQVFPYGHFCYEFTLDEDGNVASQKLHFTVQEELMPFCQKTDDAVPFPLRKGQTACHTVTTSPEQDGRPSTDFTSLLEFARTQHCGQPRTIYAFYVYSLRLPSGLQDYYDCYLLTD